MTLYWGGCYSLERYFGLITDPFSLPDPDVTKFLTPRMDHKESSGYNSD